MMIKILMNNFLAQLRQAFAILFLLQPECSEQCCQPNFKKIPKSNIIVITNSLLYVYFSSHLIRRNKQVLQLLTKLFLIKPQINSPLLKTLKNHFDGRRGNLLLPCICLRCYFQYCSEFAMCSV